MKKAKSDKMHVFLHFFAKKFGHIKKKQYLCTRFRKRSNGPLAQLNRVPHYGCGGCRFESCTDHTKDAQYIERLFLFVADDIIRDI